MTQKIKRPIDEGDWNMAFLFPDEIAAARARTGLVILPWRRLSGTDLT